MSDSRFHSLSSYINSTPTILDLIIPARALPLGPLGHIIEQTPLKYTRNSIPSYFYLSLSSLASTRTDSKLITLLSPLIFPLFNERAHNNATIEPAREISASCAVCSTPVLYVYLTGLTLRERALPFFFSFPARKFCLPSPIHAGYFRGLFTSHPLSLRCPLSLVFFFLFFRRMMLVLLRTAISLFYLRCARRGLCRAARIRAQPGEMRVIVVSV